MKPCYACVEVREFPLQAMLRLRPEMRGKPVVILDGEPPFQQVCAISPGGYALNIELGMTKLDLELFPSAVVLPRAHAEEVAARGALLQCAAGFSPRIEELSSRHTFTCVIDIAGTETLFGSPQTLAKALMEKLHRLGLEPVIAMSSNFQTARYLARGHSAGEIVSVPSGMEARALSSLPLSVLDLTEELKDTFRSWGMSTLGDLASLHEPDLIARLGQSCKELRLLARGESTHLFVPIEESMQLEETMVLDSPVELLDSLLFVLGVMLDQLIARARGSILALASITLTLNLDNGTSHVRTVRPALPNNERPLWLKLIHLDLEAHPPLASVVSLQVNAEPGSTSNVQLGLFSPQVPESSRLDVTLARIRSIVGDNHVGRAVLKDSHRPDAFLMEPFTVPATATKEPAAQTRRVAQRQIRPPESVTVTLHQQQPKSFMFRSRRYLVEQAYGPWACSGDWWNPTLWSFEQWDLVARGKDSPSTLCCCLTHNLVENRWQIEALYD
jgi:protein ImuB